MSITAYVGLPGSGKSYGVMENVIIPAVKEGREVWTNIPLVSDLFMEKYGYCPVQFKTQDVLDDDNWFQDVLPKGTLVIIDECWRLWPAGLKANNALEQHKSFLAEHRHMVGESGRSIEIILVTQDLMQMATFARNLVENTYRSVKLSAVGANKKYRIDIYQGLATGPTPPDKNKLDSMYGSYKKDVFEHYQSHTQSATGMAGNESKSDSRSNLLKGNWLKYSVLAIIVLGYMAFMGFKHVAAGFGHDLDSDELEVSKLDRVESSSHKSQLNEPKLPVKQHKLDVLAGRDLQIVWNNGHYPNVDYVISAIKGSSSFRLNEIELSKLGYELRSINECLVLISMNRARYTATCHSDTSGGLVNFDWNVGSDQKS